MGLSIINKIRLLSQLNKTVNAVEKAVEMKNTTKVILAIIAGLGGFLQIPVVQSAVVAFLTAHPSVSLILGAITTMLALIHNPVAADNPQSTSGISTKVGMILLCALLLGGAMAVSAQTTATPNGLVTSADAVAVYTASSGMIGSNYQSGVVAKVGYDIWDPGKLKTNHVYVESTVFNVPALNMAYYGGGLAWQPDISKAFTHLNLVASDFNLLMDGGAGVLNTSTSTTSTSAVAGHAGLALKYNFNPQLAWTTVRLESLFTPGQPVHIGISTGLILSLTKTQ